ncbi:MAG: 30S ribosomal protein S2 [Sedimentisphaerales bacterium]|nr:30S ribosomal protein S2 [Sedimentisphaerales bacterium]
MAKELVRELINAGVHFGHGASRWNPKMAPFIFAKRGKIHIIDVKKTLEGILIAKRLIAEIVSSGKDVVFVGTKRQAQKPVETVAEKCGMHYVSQRWLGGMLTNFRTVRSRLQRLQELENMQTDGTLQAESKKQASRLKREMRKIKANLEGVRNMARLPGVVVVVDAKKEHLALCEAKKLGIATVGLIDTDSDPDTIDVAIPANDDSIRAIDLILGELADAVAIGKTMVSAKQEPRQRPKRIRSRRPALAQAHLEEKPVEQPEAAQQPPEAEEPALQQPAEEKKEPEKPEETTPEKTTEPASQQTNAEKTEK